MKGIFFTAAAMMLMSFSVAANNESREGAPTLWPKSRPESSLKIKIDYDDNAAQEKAKQVDAQQFESKNTTTRYFEMMGGEENGQRNLNYGNNTRLAPIQGRINK